MAGAKTGEEITGQGGLLSQLTKRMVERAMEVELTDHLGYEPHAEPPGGAGNTRNGSTPKTLMTEHGPVRINTPRDRAGSFEPQIVRKRQRRFDGFDDKILALYARGMSTRDISAHLEEIYGVEVGRDLISKVTDAVMDDARAWQTRPLDDLYPVVFLDALVLKIRDGGSVIRKACYLALAINLDGDREVLGMWFQDTEGAKFWMQVLTELKQRGVTDILIACVDGLKGFPEAIEAVFPQTTVQTCIVHLIRAVLQICAAPPVRRGRQGPQTDLHSDQPRPGDGRARAVRGQMAGASDRRADVAGVLAARDPVHGLRTRSPPRDLHHQRDRGVEPAATQSDQNEGQLPVRGGRNQAALPRDPQRRAAMDPDPRVDESDARVQDPIRRPHPRLTIKPAYTDFRTLSDPQAPERVACSGMGWKRLVECCFIAVGIVSYLTVVTLRRGAEGLIPVRSSR